MNATKREKEIYGDAVEILSRSEEQVVYRIANETGEVVMTSYQVFPGIELLYNDVHIRKCFIEHTQVRNMIEINHCRTGRIEFEFEDKFFYLTEGDIAISKKGNSTHESFFPLSHYHGITVMLDIDRAPECLSCFLEDVNVCPSSLLEKFCADQSCFIARSLPCLEHIFSELYQVPESIKKGYFKVKILELLLFLCGMECSENESCKRSVKKAHVTMAKNACAYLTEHMEKHITIPELSALFHVSQTALKNSFKDVYGVSIYSYMRTQKMQAAALQLCQSERTILEIAGQYGYNNGSKFASAFASVLGTTPQKYRNLKNNGKAAFIPDVEQK